MMVLLYGFSLMYILSGLMAYSLSAFQILLMTIACYLFNKMIFRSTKVLVGVTITGAVLSMGTVYALYKFELLESTVTKVQAFIKAYYLSVSVETVYIDGAHQAVVLLLIGVALLRALEKYININKTNFKYLLSASCLIIVVGFLLKSLGSSEDHKAFLILCTTMLIYYFLSFYRKYTDSKRSFSPYMITVLFFIGVIIVGAGLLYKLEPRPLVRINKAVGFQMSDEVVSMANEQDKLSFYKQETSKIDNSFEYDNIEVLRIKTQNTRYLKADTYELYSDGQWSRSDNLVDLGNRQSFIHKSTEVDSIDYLSFYKLEEVSITIRNIMTNVLFINNYGTTKNRFFERTQVMNDTKRGIYFTNTLLDYGYRYEFTAVLPAYGNEKFDNLVRKHSNEEIMGALDNYREPLDDKYSEIADLASTIISGIDNKYDQALAIESYLKEHYMYKETLETVPEGVDPINYFLFVSKEGFCQQFSTALILMLRSIDIPARYARGFYVDLFREEGYGYQMMVEANRPYDEMITLYDSDAHTWTEAYFNEVGWITLEATPGKVYRTEVNNDHRQEDMNEGEIAKDQVTGIIHIDIIHIYSVVGLIGVGLCLYLTVRLSRYNLMLHKQTETEKMLRIHKIIGFYFTVKGLGQGDSETPREYAVRMDDYLSGYIDYDLIDLMKDYEDVIYGGYELCGGISNHINYLKILRQIFKERMNRVVYIHMRIREYYIFLN